VPGVCIIILLPKLVTCVGTNLGRGCMLRDYSACQVRLSADTLATATSASDLASPASADVRSAAEQRNGLAAT
jgi:hypothetical protein